MTNEPIINYPELAKRIAESQALNSMLFYCSLEAQDSLNEMERKWPQHGPYGEVIDTAQWEVNNTPLTVRIASQNNIVLDFNIVAKNTQEPFPTPFGTIGNLAAVRMAHRGGRVGPLPGKLALTWYSHHEQKRIIVKSRWYEDTGHDKYSKDVKNRITKSYKGNPDNEGGITIKYAVRSP